MRDRFKILVAKRMVQGVPNGRMIQLAAFRYYTDAVDFFDKMKSRPQYAGCYAQMVEGRVIMDVIEPKEKVTMEWDD